MIQGYLLNNAGIKVKRLQEIFEKRFHYTTQTFEIPSEKSETGLQRKIADFAHEYNGPNNLMISLLQWPRLYWIGDSGFETCSVRDDSTSPKGVAILTYAPL